MKNKFKIIENIAFILFFVVWTGVAIFFWLKIPVFFRQILLILYIFYDIIICAKLKIFKEVYYGF